MDRLDPPAGDDHTFVVRFLVREGNRKEFLDWVCNGLKHKDFITGFDVLLEDGQVPAGDAGHQFLDEDGTRYSYYLWTRATRHGSTPPQDFARTVQMAMLMMEQNDG